MAARQRLFTDVLAKLRVTFLIAEVDQLWEPIENIFVAKIFSGWRRPGEPRSSCPIKELCHTRNEAERQIRAAFIFAQARKRFRC
jgi:hypothetical protein